MFLHDIYVSLYLFISQGKSCGYRELKAIMAEFSFFPPSSRVFSLKLCLYEDLSGAIFMCLRSYCLRNLLEGITNMLKKMRRKLALKVSQNKESYLENYFSRVEEKGFALFKIKHGMKFLVNVKT